MLNDYDTGKLVAHVDKCNETMERLTKNVEELEVRLEKLDNQLAKGRGKVAGFLLAVGALGTWLTVDWSKVQQFFGGG